MSSDSTSETSLSYNILLSRLVETESELEDLLSLISGPQRIVDASPTISRFALLLSTLSISGPCDLQLPHSHLGTGAQFMVFEQEIHGMAKSPDTTIAPQNGTFLVAVKIPRFKLDDGRRLDLSNSDYGRQIRHMIIEITALCHPVVRNHPNVVDLIAWGYSTRDRYGLPFLALDLADGNLAMFLRSRPLCPLGMRHHFSLDVGYGLDAVHSINLIHGDLKPENVLIFYIAGSWVAKIADFAGGVDMGLGGELESRGTIGWRAPEMWKDFDIEARSFDKVDHYSYGLLLWSLFLRDRGTVPFDESVEAGISAMSELEIAKERLPMSLFDALKASLPMLLQQDPNNRPEKLGRLLEDGSSVCQDWLGWYDPTGSAAFPYNVNKALTTSLDARYAWEIPEISNEAAADLRPLFLFEKDSLSITLIYGMFLKTAACGRRLYCNPSKQKFLHQTIGKRTLILDLLRVGAQRGCEPMRALIYNVYEYLRAPIACDINDCKRTWISEAVAGGSFFSRKQLQHIDNSLLQSSVKQFQESGGYNRFYSDCIPNNMSAIVQQISSEAISNIDRKAAINRRGDLFLHILSCVSLPETLSALLKLTDKQEINAPNTYGETALYRACMAGLTSNVLSLLLHGADPSISPFNHSATCLHWLFHFDPRDIPTVSGSLIRHGANIHAHCSTKIPLLHYPFALPQGTPLHWAVEMSSPEAVRALLALGADTSLRDRSDPYMFDENVRILNMTLPPDRIPCSIALASALGLSAIDIAVKNLDHEILEILLTSDPDVDVDDVDEEGYTAIHRLDARKWIYTTQGSKLWSPLFTGTLESQAYSLRKTLDVLIHHGFSLNKLTQNKSRNGSHFGFSAQTALMLSVTKGNISTIKALLEAGANVNIMNNQGETALLSTTDDYVYEEEIQLETITPLLEANADIHSRNSYGTTALCQAASNKLLGVVSTLLRHGADIKDRKTRVIPPNGRNVFALAISCGIDDAPVYDNWLLSQLQCHVFPFLHPPESSILYNEILEKADFKGGTLLHYTAANGLFQCCKALLDAGAKVNGLQRYLKRRRGGTVAGFHTPLDEALKTKIHQRRFQLLRFSEKETEKQLIVYDQIVKLLRDAGGLHGNDLKAKEFIDNEDEFWLQYPHVKRP